MRKKDIITDYYDGELRRDPGKFQHLGWENQEAQFRRFSVLTEHVRLESKKILDVGCGLGHLVDHLKEKKINADYTGVDLLSSMAKDALERHENCRFVAGDLFAENLFEEKSFDVIYCSGIFNLNMGNNRDFLLMAISHFLSLTREAVVFNLLHKKSPRREDKFFYFYPDQVIRDLELLPQQIDSIQLIENYLENDFTLILRQQDGPNE